MSARKGPPTTGRPWGLGLRLRRHLLFGPSLASRPSLVTARPSLLRNGRAGLAATGQVWAGNWSAGLQASL